MSEGVVLIAEITGLLVVLVGILVVVVEAYRFGVSDGRRQIMDEVEREREQERG